MRKQQHVSHQPSRPRSIVQRERPTGKVGVPLGREGPAPGVTGVSLRSQAVRICCVASSPVAFEFYDAMQSLGPAPEDVHQVVLEVCLPRPMPLCPRGGGGGLEADAPAPDVLAHAPHGGAQYIPRIDAPFRSVCDVLRWRCQWARPHVPGGGQRMEEQGTWAAQKHSEAGYGRPVDRGVWTAKTVKRPRQQPAHPQYANYWAPLTRKRHTMPHSAQPQHTNYWAPRTRKQHQQEHRPQRPTESSDPTQYAKGRTGDRPGPRKGATTRRNVTQGARGRSTSCGICRNFVAPEYQIRGHSPA